MSQCHCVISVFSSHFECNLQCHYKTELLVLIERTFCGQLFSCTNIKCLYYEDKVQKQWFL